MHKRAKKEIKKQLFLETKGGNIIIIKWHFFLNVMFGNNVTSGLKVDELFGKIRFSTIFPFFKMFFFS
jgi:hypothetical protein